MKMDDGLEPRGLDRFRIHFGDRAIAFADSERKEKIMVSVFSNCLVVLSFSEKGKTVI